MSSIKTSTIAVTGATGFVGQATVAALRQLYPDSSLRLLVRNPRRRELPAALAGSEIVAGDLHDPPALKSLVRDAGVVVHIAAAIAGNNAADFERDNISGSRRLVEAIAATNPETHLIHLSSLAARQPELSWYSASKRAAEEVVASSVQRFSILRPPAVYGPTDPALAGFWRMLARGWLIRPGPVDARFSMLHVDDLADAVCRLAGQGPASAILPLAGPQPEGGWSWAELARVAGHARGKSVRTVGVPGAMLGAGAGLGLVASRVMRRRAMLTPGKARELLHRDWVCDNLAMAQWLGWMPTTRFERALATLPGWSNQ